MGEHPLAHYRRKRAQRGHIREPTHQKKSLPRSFLRPNGLPRQLIEKNRWLREHGVKKASVCSHPVCPKHSDLMKTILLKCGRSCE